MMIGINLSILDKVLRQTTDGARFNVSKCECKCHPWSITMPCCHKVNWSKKFISQCDKVACNIVTHNSKTLYKNLITDKFKNYLPSAIRFPKHQDIRKTKVHSLIGLIQHWIKAQSKFIRKFVSWKVAEIAVFDSVQQWVTRNEGISSKWSWRQSTIPKIKYSRWNTRSIQIRLGTLRLCTRIEDPQ